MSQQSKSKIFRLGFKTNDWDSKYIETNNEDRSLSLYQELQIKEFLFNIFKINGIFIYDFNIFRSHNSINIVINYFSIVPNITKDQPFKNQLSDFLNTFNDDNQIFKNKRLINSGELKNNEYNISITFILKIIKLYVGDSYKISLKLLNVKKSFFFKEHFKKKLLKIIFQLKRYKKSPFFFQTLMILLVTYQKKNSSELIAGWVALQLSKMKIHNRFLSFLSMILIILLNSYFSNIKGIKILIKGRLNNKPRKQTRIIQAGKISLQTFDTTINQSQKVAYTKNGTLGIKVWICEN